MDGGNSERIERSAKRGNRVHENFKEGIHAAESKQTYNERETGFCIPPEYPWEEHEMKDRKAEERDSEKGEIRVDKDGISCLPKYKVCDKCEYRRGGELGQFEKGDDRHLTLDDAPPGDGKNERKFRVAVAPCEGEIEINSLKYESYAHDCRVIRHEYERGERGKE